jgi:sterol desaturase/sphingolipid hydroxylase (fatty acid hydroxylase superfamily)
MGRDSTRADAEDAKGTFVQYLFPKRVWSHPSARLDLRYFIFHRTIMQFVLLGMSLTMTLVAFAFVSGGRALPDMTMPDTTMSFGAGLLLATLFMLIAVTILDFVAFYIHYLQHKIPLLWQFHKVHHSSEVMHPVSNFREHPIDNIVYESFTGLAYGAVAGVAARFLGYIPTMPMLLGVPVVAFLFNIVAYNLRHSHVWLRWPGVWSAVFPSPAHHHVHHSCHPDHLDKNFAFLLPVWDVLFGTYHMPEDNRDVKFGIIDDGSDLTSCLRLYFVPFRDAWHVLRYGTTGDSVSPARPPENTDRPPITPAE